MPKNTFAFIVFCVAMLSGFGLWAQQFKSKASVAKNTFIVGDSIGVQINIQGETGHIYRLQELPRLQGLEWLDSNLLQQDFTTNNFTVPVMGFDSGVFTFPRLVFNVFSADNDVVVATQTDPIEIHITYAQVDTSKDIKPIHAPMEVAYSPMPLWPFILLGLLLLAVAVYLYIRWKKKQAKPIQQAVIQAEAPKDPLSYGHEAIKQIEQSKNNMVSQTEQQYWFGLKEILRNYIYKHYTLHTAPKTSSQILAALRKKPIAGQDVHTLQHIFSRADLVLFAKQGTTTEEKNAAAEDAIVFIKSTLQKEEI